MTGAPRPLAVLRFGVACLAAWAVLGAAEVAVAQEGGSATARLGGHVVDELDGSPIPNAVVEACRDQQIYEPALVFCRVTRADAAGAYAFDALLRGTYGVRASPPEGDARHVPGIAGPAAAGDGFLAVQDVALPRIPMPRADTTINGVPVGRAPVTVYWGSPISISAVGCPEGQASYRVRLGGVIVRSGPMRPAVVPANRFEATIAPLAPLHGAAFIEITISGCHNPAANGSFSICIYIDPSGNVRTRHGGRPIVNAKVTLLHATDAAGPFAQLADGSALMSPGNRRNPDRTDATGHFGWDVVAGYYRVRAQKDGCDRPGRPHLRYSQSAVLRIPPAVLDLDIRLDCVLELPVPLTCSRTRRLVLRARPVRLRRLVVTVDGARRAVVAHRRIRTRTTVRLRDRDRNRSVRVRATGKTTAGTVLTTAQTYRLC